jgi:5-methylcytosine-specific restriction endonuclease McrA
MRGKRTTPATIICAQCAEPFERRPHLVAFALRKGLTRFYCSRACHHLAARRGETRACKICGGEFYYNQATNKGSTGEYCSRPCQNIGFSAKMKGRQKTPDHLAKIADAQRGKPKYGKRAPAITWQCEHCGVVRELTLRQRSNALANHHRFCSRECWRSYLKEHPEASGTYRGGKLARHARGPNWEDQAALARERDDHTCQDCGHFQTHPKLNVHHRTPFRWFDGDWLRANDLDNLVTLCVSCHTRRERRIDF